MSTMKRNEAKTSLRSWQIFYIEAKRTLLILHLRKIEAKRIPFIPQIGKIEEKGTLIIPGPVYRKNLISYLMRKNEEIRGKRLGPL